MNLWNRSRGKLCSVQFLYLTYSPCSGACSWKAWGWILWVMSLSAALCVVHAEVSSNLSFVGDTGECSVFPVTSKHGLSWRCLQDTSDTGSISSGADVQVCRTFGRHEFFPCCSDITSLDGRDVYRITIHKLYDIKYTVWYGRYGNIVFKGQ